MPTVASLHAQYASGALVPADVIKSCWRHDNDPDRPSTNSYISRASSESLLRDAAASAERYARGTPLSPLDGVPIAVKDNFATVDLPTTCASRMLEGFEAGYDATVVARLRAAGAIIMGKTNMDEFGMGSFGIQSSSSSLACGDGGDGSGTGVRNPVTRKRDRVAGGSSSGSAAAVASGAAVAAIGSDTGGSVRLPAAWTGTVGWKPSRGRCSRHGLVAYASSLDTPGVLAGSVRCAAAVANIMSGACE
eukprot:UC1_evm1s1399